MLKSLKRRTHDGLGLQLYAQIYSALKRKTRSRDSINDHEER